MVSYSILLIVFAGCLLGSIYTIMRQMKEWNEKVVVVITDAVRQTSEAIVEGLRGPSGVVEEGGEEGAEQGILPDWTTWGEVEDAEVGVDPTDRVLMDLPSMDSRDRAVGVKSLDDILGPQNND